jgi:hypothetical protein
MTPSDKLMAAEAAAIQENYSKRDSVCWSCDRSCGGRGCPWADSLTVPDFWKDGDVVERSVGCGPSFQVRKCPMFAVDPKRPLEYFEARGILMEYKGGQWKQKIVRLRQRRFVEFLLNIYNMDNKGIRPAPLAIRPPSEDEDEEENDQCEK